MKTRFNYKLHDTKVIREIPLDGSNFPILIHPDAQQVLYTNFDYQTEIIILNLFENRKYRLGKHHTSIISLSQSIDGKKIISYSVDGEIRFWDLISKKVLFSIKRNEYKFRWIDEYEFCKYLDYSDYYLKLSPDASYFILFNNRLVYGRLEIWDVKTKNINHVIELDCSMLEFKISPDSKCIAYLTDENSIRIVDLNLNVKEIEFELFDEKDRIHDFRFCNNHRILLIHTKNIIQEFDIQSSSKIKIHRFNTSAENSLLYTVSNVFSDIRIVLVFLQDHGWELVIYDLENKVSLKKFIISNKESKEWEIRQVFVSPNGNIILVYFKTDIIQVWIPSSY